MLAQWLGDFVGQMHLHKITKTQLAEEMGVSREYISMVLNGHREPAGIEQRMRDAADTWNIKKIISSANAIELLNSFLNTSPPNFIGGHTLENVQMCTIEQRLGLLTAENLELVNRRIETLLASQSSDR